MFGLAKDEMKDIINTSRVFCYLSNILKDPKYFYKKIQHMNFFNCEELFLILRAMRQEIVCSVSITYDLLYLTNIDHLFMQKRTTQELYKVGFIVLSNYLAFEMLSFQVQDQETGTFYEFTGTSISPKNQFKAKKSNWRTLSINKCHSLLLFLKIFGLISIHFFLLFC